MKLFIVLIITIIIIITFCSQSDGKTRRKYYCSEQRCNNNYDCQRVHHLYVCTFYLFCMNWVCRPNWSW
ncbi:hypothetical protein KQX54_016360 [Cotesia glomerata]|uniref:Uncharacterized protein n=1 Tax=Cotesia glomerata TaxID=32391 RepID=A0AAV7IW08_COTGL|nr:hypothetical protein KQX54_016360 [Cotesia glomerata]